MKTENILIIVALFVVILLLFSNFSVETPTAPIVFQTPSFLSNSFDDGPQPCPFPFGCGGKGRPGRGGWFPRSIIGGGRRMGGRMGGGMSRRMGGRMGGGSGGRRMGGGRGGGGRGGGGGGGRSGGRRMGGGRGGGGEVAEVAAEEVVEEVEKLKISSIYKMPRIVLLTDDHIIEGMIGMLSLIMVAYIINHAISASRSIILGMAFIISWYFRRIGVNIYRHMKKKYSISISPITYDVT